LETLEVFELVAESAKVCVKGGRVFGGHGDGEVGFAGK